MRDQPRSTLSELLALASGVATFLNASGLAGALVIWLGASALPAAEPDYAKDVWPVLRARCVKCHGGEETAGNIDFRPFQDAQHAARSRKVWRQAAAQLEAGAMPPADARQLAAEEKSRLLDWMRQTLDVLDCGDAARRDPGPSLIRRLTLSEYNRTVRDLLGFEFDAAATVGMTADAGEGNTFGNLAAALEVSPALLEKYFAAADQVLDRFFGTELSSSVDGRIQEQARLGREQMFQLKPGEWRRADFEVGPPMGVEPREAARALVTAFVRRAYRGQGTAVDVDRLLALFDRAQELKLSYRDSVRAMLKGVLVSPKFLFRIEQNVPTATPDEAARVSDVELAVRLSYFLWSSLPDEELLDLAERGRLTVPGPSQELLKLAGRPISAPGSETHQGNNRDKVFDGDLATQLDGPDAASYWIGLDLGAPRSIRRLRFAGRIGFEPRLVGGKFEASSAADFSRDVVLLHEIAAAPPRGWAAFDLPEPVERRYIRYVPPQNSFGNIAELEARGPGPGTVLEQQVRRMLADPRARALTDDFAVPWLQLHKLPTARPSTEFFPEFNAHVRQAMFDETTTFFDALRREDRSLLDLLDSDYTYVNEDLARYYGLPEVQGKELQRVALTPTDHRGGLLGMGSVLAVTSHTSRTSPTLRGKWILDVLFGTPPPPPPANVSQIKEEPNQTKQDVETFRDKLAQHARDTSCAACHRKMDPLGFALDNYNAVGRWREKQGDQPLDVTGVLPTGETLNGAADLKRIILARKADFLRNVSEKMLSYALGRELEDIDECTVRDITTQLTQDDSRFSTLILEIVRSDPFQNRRHSAE